MKYAIDFGHNAPNRDIGAKGIKFEDDMVVQVGTRLVDLLIKAGHDVVLTQPKSSQSVNASLQYRCDLANRMKCDVFVSLHFNSFSNPNAKGTEVWIASSNSRVKNEATYVVQNIATLGFVNRGVKVGNFKVLTGTNMPAMLVEGCFVSSPIDCTLFDAEKMAIAIFNGLNKNEVKPTIKTEPHKENTTLVVTVQTLLKPSTEQSNTIDKSLLKSIETGEYRINLLADEEGHYLITFDENTEANNIYGNKQWFIFSEHCEVR